ncbi:ARF-binding protein [Yamadazyma tenuis]|uniref:VHS-domain-containing protein n=1 Tax=Candida tenuis (strain ATCC 10573 / BCRC 21748 / CBS 615 / JCM 9827 / NBRC 10315 / NRRL Y-1498 / VKM Y-70) TaxID=590646 RepID=G3AX60_CANTC|nr:uncharacterized protein CANTEDRAFT_117883 [Yamadazyma tenuis ATCC 10573]EGV66695.1 hypothetical protein CANTEDRAFT_117883 [Yamadazyma tenuis ATCC 10573]WEJ95172.1 ARF-binding protein [Yamadazyma tenuis]
MSSSSGYSLSKINPKLLRRIYRACRPSLDEPNLALNLEICDYVNAKQGSIPRDAAITVVKLISQKDPQTSELALSLLDNLVKNCGYPFHLQVSRKEFLNELVKRFPERPPLRYTRVQRLILAQIEEWYQTICKTSKYKEDFGYIKNMHTLLSHKGYIFPEVKVEDAAVLNPADTLKSFEELQKEEEVVNSAKLQELIRRGRPQDLSEANKLMKIMAGFKESNKVEENKQQILQDIARLKRKAEILDEMLTAIQQNGGKIEESNEAAHELYGSVKSNQPIINKIIEEEHDNEQRVGELLSLNDNINTLINKFQLLKGGKVDEASKMKANLNQDLNLIDFDDDEPISNDQTGKDTQGYNDLLSDLTSLSFGGEPSKKTNDDILNLFGSGGSIALGSNTPQPTEPSSKDFDLLAGFSSPSPQLQSNVQTTPVQSNNVLDAFELSFPSSTPSNITSTISKKTIHQSKAIQIDVELYSTGTTVNGKFFFRNVGIPTSTIAVFKFLVAAPKSCKLELKPQSGETLSGGSSFISQEFTIQNDLNKPLKIKWKADYTYQFSQTTQTETGVSEL